MGRTLRGLRDLKDPKFYMAVGGAAAGGAALTAAFSQVAGRWAWLNSGEWAGLKRTGAALAMALVGGALTKGRFPNVAAGMAGAIGALGYVDNAGRVHAELAFPMLGMPTVAGYLANWQDPAPALTGTRTYDQRNENLFGLNAVRVGQGDERAFASVLATAAA